MSNNDQPVKLESGKMSGVSRLDVGFEDKVLRNLNFQSDRTIPGADPYGTFSHVRSSDLGFSSGFVNSQNTAVKNASSTDKSKTAFSKLPQYYH